MYVTHSVLTSVHLTPLPQVAVLAIFILPDFPSNTRWLSPQERQIALLRMEEDVGVGDQGETETGGQANGLWMAITDWKVWWLAFALTSLVVALSFNAYFPTLTATLGFSPTLTLLLCAPPFVVAAIATYWTSLFVSLIVVLIVLRN